jgi:hypothetical protein
LAAEKALFLLSWSGDPGYWYEVLSAAKRHWCDATWWRGAFVLTGEGIRRGGKGLAWLPGRSTDHRGEEHSDEGRAGIPGGAEMALVAQGPVLC